MYKSRQYFAELKQQGELFNSGALKVVYFYQLGGDGQTSILLEGLGVILTQAVVMACFGVIFERRLKKRKNVNLN